MGWQVFELETTSEILSNGVSLIIQLVANLPVLYLVFMGKNTRNENNLQCMI